MVQDKIRYPDDQTFARCEWFLARGATSQLLDRYWSEIKAHWKSGWGWIQSFRALCVIPIRTPWHREDMPEAATGSGEEIRALEGYHLQAWTEKVERISRVPRWKVKGGQNGTTHIKIEPSVQSDLFSRAQYFDSLRAGNYSARLCLRRNCENIFEVRIRGGKAACRAFHGCVTTWRFPSKGVGGHTVRDGQQLIDGPLVVGVGAVLHRVNPSGRRDQEVSRQP